MSTLIKYRKKIVNRVIWYFLITLLLILCSCNHSFAPIVSTADSSAVNIDPTETEVIKPTVTISPTLTPIYHPTYTTNNVRPVAISYIKKTDRGEGIFSKSLSKGIEYSSILIDKDTYLRGPIAVDADNNLYVIYGSGKTYLSKLGLNGSIKTIELPVHYLFQSLWVGDQLIILRAPALAEIDIINKNLEIQTLSPPFDTLLEDIYQVGVLGIGNSSANQVVWVSQQPVRNENGDFVFFRTLDLDHGDATEGFLPIPTSTENWSPTGNSDDRLGTFVYGVDTNSRNVLLCYGHAGTENNINTTIELFSTSKQHTIVKENRCCLNNMFDLRGETIIENVTPESCSFSSVKNWSDYQPSFDFEEYLSVGRSRQNWLTSNGRYWMLLTDSYVVIFNESKQYEATYNLPSDLPPDLVPGATISVAFSLPN